MTEAISIRVTPSVKQELERAAADDQRTLSQYVERLLVAHLSEIRPKSKKGR
jgi:uncharacterized protein (DUF1778 family)